MARCPSRTWPSSSAPPAASGATSLAGPGVPCRRRLRGRAVRPWRAGEVSGKAGMKVDEFRVWFDRDFSWETVAKTPATFELQARRDSGSVVLGGATVVPARVYGPPFITDLERGRRGATIEDFNNFDKMAQAIDQIHCAGGTTVEPEDLPLGSRHLDMVYSHLRWTDKPFMGSVISRENARDTIEMASTAFGGRDLIETPPALTPPAPVSHPLPYAH